MASSANVSCVTLADIRAVRQVGRSSVILVGPQRILVVGAGHVGFYAALRLSKKLRSTEAEVTVVDPQPHMTYQPFLPEAAAGNISPRHTVVPLRRELKRCHILSGEVTKIEHARRVATVQPIVGPPREVSYDHIVVGPGSVSRTLPVPGLRENAVGFKTIGEAIWLRNHVLDRLDVAATTVDKTTRQRALTFVFVGGGYAGIEALAEMEDMARSALRYYEELDPEEMRWVLVEATQRILPEVDPDMGAYTVDQLIRRNMDIRLGTRLESCVDGVVKLSDGDSLRGGHDRMDGRRKAVPTYRRDRPAARRQGQDHVPADAAGRAAPTDPSWTAPGARGLCGGAGSDLAGARGAVLAERTARRTPGEATRGQPAGAAAGQCAA